MIDSLLTDLPERVAQVLALEATRRLVPLLYDLEHYVEAKLIEVACEEALEFYVAEGRVFNRVYGHVDAMGSRLQEVGDRAALNNALQAALYATVRASSEIFAYEMTIDGPPGPASDCVLAESSPDDPRRAIEHVRAAENELAGLLERSGTRYQPLTEWLPGAIAELRRPNVDLGTWIATQPGLDVRYPFRRERGGR